MPDQVREQQYEDDLPERAAPPPRGQRPVNRYSRSRDTLRNSMNSRERALDEAREAEQIEAAQNETTLMDRRDEVETRQEARRAEMASSGATMLDEEGNENPWRRIGLSGLEEIVARQNGMDMSEDEMKEQMERQRRIDEYKRQREEEMARQQQTDLQR